MMTLINYLNDQEVSMGLFAMVVGCLIALAGSFVFGFCYGVKTEEKLDSELIDLLKRDRGGE